MFATIKQIFSPKNKDIQKRILFTLACLAVFILGKSIVVPGINKYQLGVNQLGFLELINVMGGGALSQFSIFALGVMPYISASIVIQILSSVDIIPYLSELRKQGGTGRNQLNKITRITGIALAFLQGYVYSFSFLGNNGILNIDYLQFALVLTAGTCLLLWIGDQITAKGIGNGISLIIMAGIISSLPTMFVTAFKSLVLNGTISGIILFILYVVFYVLIILGVVYVEGAERRISVQYANKSNSSYGGMQNYIPFKLNSAGVMPVILSSTFLSLFSFVATILKKDGFTAFVENYLTLTKPVGLVIYVVLIFAFAYLYTFIQIKPSEMSDNLNKNGGYIPGVRPNETTEYINKVLTRITTAGALFLSILAAIPVLFGMFSGLPGNVTIGGTGLLIVVGVALETYKQLESQLQSRTYRKGRR